MMKKKLLYFKLTFYKMFSNKIRVVLTTIGVSIGLFIYVLGNVFCDSTVRNMYKNAFAFPENFYFCNFFNTDSDKIENKLKKCDFEYDKWCVHSSSQNDIFNNRKKYNQSKISYYTTLISASSTLNNNLVYLDLNNSDNLYSGKILYGRDFIKKDFDNKSKVIIITKSFSKMFFSTENSVGKKIDYIINGKLYSFEVVGVINDPVNVVQYNLDFNKSLKSKNKKLEYTSSAYIPDMLFNTIYKDKLSFDSYTIYKVDDNKKGYEFFNSINNPEIRIVSQKSLLKEAKENELEMKSFYTTLSIVILLIAGFIVMTIMFFSIKERIFEIGIRRALGAHKSDILIQFILESVIISFIAWIVTIIISISLCVILSFVFINYCYIDFYLKLNWKIVFNSLSIALIQGIVFSIIPAIYASKIRPTEAIRWE